MHCTRRYFRLFWGLIIFLSFQFIFILPNSFANPIGPEIVVEQLHQYNMTIPIPYSTVGMVTYFYTPESFGYFFNIVAIDKFEQPQWIVRNLYIPDNSWFDRAQSISTRFCLASLGYLSGEQVGNLEMAFIRSDTVFSVMPKPESFSTMALDTLKDDGQGDFTEIPPLAPKIGEYPRFPEFEPLEQIKPIEFRGCRVPNIELDDSTYPDTEDYAGDHNACGPASATNSLGWLDSAYKQIELPGSERKIIEELSKLMKRPRNGGVTIDNFIQGKLDFIEVHKLPINVKFQSSFVAKDVTSSSGDTYARNDNKGAYPTWEWLSEQMKAGEDVEIMYYWWDGETWHGHAVVVTGVEENEDGTKKSVKFKHDVRQGWAGGTKQEDESIYIDSYGRMILRSRGAFIGNAVAESPGEPYPTPVELGLFTAEAVNADVHLRWKTESESNNYGFEIFRDNQKIAFVEGKGTTIEPQNYSYIDNRLISGTYHYELVQIDFDGTKANIGNVNVVVMNNPAQFVLSQNHPNPFNATTKITYSIPMKGNVSIKLYNMLGKEIETLLEENKEVGVYSIDFDASHLANGIYFYRMEASGFTQVRKLLLLK